MGLHLSYLQVNFMDNMVKMHSSLKLDCIGIIAAIHALLGTLSSLEDIWKDKLVSFSLKDFKSEQVFTILLVLL